MSEWGLTPLYVLNEMTEEQFSILLHAHNERLRATMQPKEEHEQPAKRVSDAEFFANHQYMTENLGRVVGVA